MILIAHQNGVADVAVHGRGVWEKLHLVAPRAAREPLPQVEVEPVTGATLSISHLTVRFGSVLAVDEVSLDVRPGEVVGLIGPNGAGKTTLIDAVTGFVPVGGGSISLDDRRIDRLNTTQRARLGLRRSFQSLELFEDISVEENIRAGSDLRASRMSWLTDLFWPGRHELPPTAIAAVHEFELGPHLDQTPDELPYGRRRLVGIARTVASGPSVVLLDEPAAGLDERESAELARLIRRLADERNMAVLLVEHDVGLVMSTCDRVVVIDFGRVIGDRHARGDPRRPGGARRVPRSRRRGGGSGEHMTETLIEARGAVGRLRQHAGRPRARPSRRRGRGRGPHRRERRGQVDDAAHPRRRAHTPRG